MKASVAKERKMQAAMIASSTQKVWLASSEQCQLCCFWAMDSSRVVAMGNVPFRAVRSRR